MSEKIGKYLFQLLLAVGVAVVFFSVGHLTPSLSHTTDGEVSVPESSDVTEAPATSTTDNDGTTTTAAPSTVSTAKETATTTTAKAQTTTTTPVATNPNSISINTATKEQLMSIDGVGEVFAQRIIDYREANGGFKDLEELRNIKGVGEKRYALWLPYFTLS